MQIGYASVNGGFRTFRLADLLGVRPNAELNSTGQSSIGNFLHAVGLISDCGGALHTSARARLDTIEKDPTRADQPPVLGVLGLCVLAMSQRDYLDLVDHTGRRIHPGKRGAITGPPPAALAYYGEWRYFFCRCARS